ncbi:MAG: EAL domain-containing protein [Gammaproteobacteria bacterium]|nr:EAL domain-containing protein [Gammaproteobacteria bacterium]
MKPENAMHLSPAGAFHALTEQLAGVTGEDFIREVVRRLAYALDVEYAFVSVRQPPDSLKLRIASAWHVNRAQSGSEFAVEGTPAARTLAESEVWHEDDVASLYPKDRWLRKHGVRAYCAVAIRDVDGHAIGHLGVMSRQPLQADAELISVLRALAMRAAAELRRQHLEEIQRLTAAKLGSLFRMAADILGAARLQDFQLTDISPSVEHVLGYSPAALIGQSLLHTEMFENSQLGSAFFQELKAGSHIVNRKVALRASNGSVRHARLSAEVGEFGGTRHILFSLVDVTDSQAALGQVQNLNATVDALFSTAQDAIFICSYPLANPAECKFVQVNDLACEWLGYTRNELLQSACAGVFEISDLNKLQAGAQRQRSKSESMHFRSKSGNALSCEVHARLFGEGKERVLLLRCQHRGQNAEFLGTQRELEYNYQDFFDNASDGIYRSTPEGLIISANPALARILGYDNPQELVADKLNITARIYAHAEQRAELLRRIEEHGQYSAQEFQIFRKDGTTIWVSDNSRAVKDARGHILYFEGTLQNITGRKRAEEALLRSEEKYRLLVDMSQDGVFLSQAGKLVYVNRAFAQMLGHRAEDMHGMPLNEVIDSANDGLAEKIAADSVDEHYLDPHEMHLRGRPGMPRITASVAVSRIFWRGRPAVMGTARDVTERKKVEQDLVHSAYHDALTGLPNRSFFMDRLRQAVASNSSAGSTRFALLFLDLDRFKLINDSLGHSFGDRLLTAITKRLHTCLRPADLMARYGGDEFTILLEHIQALDEATAVAERIHEELARAFNVGGRDVFTTASIGIVTSAPHYRHPDELLRDADTAMYRAKAAGKAGYVVFDDAMHQHVKANLKLETELRHALQRNEFRVYFQPILDLASGRLTGCEALVRWVHPERGLVTPSQFLAVAEETGLIIPLGWWVIETACAHLSQWRKRHKHLDDKFTVSVNIANRQFAHWLLPQRVARVLDMTGIPANSLCLEITETVFMDNPELAAETISRLRAIGVNLQMDDFGTGYSSLSALRTFKLDTLKIDRSFIAGIEKNRSDRAIVRTITVLAADLGMDVVAEGIETARQLELLRALGCRRGQGYYFSKPLAVSEVDRYLAALKPLNA